MKITKCEITAYPKSFFDPMPQVIVTFEDGTKKNLFEFYPNEISFSPNEFIGLTEKEAYTLRFNKDKAYLQS